MTARVSEWVRANAHRCVVARAILEMAEAKARSEQPAEPSPAVDNLTLLMLTKS